jgi:hypothetical protein
MEKVTMLLQYIELKVLYLTICGYHEVELG